MSNLGISAVLLPGADLETAALDLAAVVEGLVGDRFEILLVSPDASAAPDLQSRRLPVRRISGTSNADGAGAATYELVLIAAPDGQFDIRELNHLLESIEHGADVSVGYRPRVTDALVRAMQRCGWHAEVDCALTLMRREVWERIRSASTSDARRRGYRVSEVPVSHRRPHLGAPVAA